MKFDFNIRLSVIIFFVLSSFVGLISTNIMLFYEITHLKDSHSESLVEAQKQIADLQTALAELKSQQFLEKQKQIADFQAALAELKSQQVLQEPLSVNSQVSYIQTYQDLLKYLAYGIAILLIFSFVYHWYSSFLVNKAIFLLLKKAHFSLMCLLLSGSADDLERTTSITVNDTTFRAIVKVVLQPEGNLSQGVYIKCEHWEDFKTLEAFLRTIQTNTDILIENRELIEFFREIISLF
jgi:hypothetical protein